MRHALLGAILLVVGCQSSMSSIDGLGATPSDRESYNLGYQLGTSLKRQDTAVNVAAYVSGMRDSLAGQRSRSSGTQLEAAIASLRSSAAQQRQR